MLIFFHATMTSYFHVEVSGIKRECEEEEEE